MDRSVTVVIPTRNRWHTLSVALRTALDQSGVDLRVLVADQCSTDGTADRLEALGDERVRVMRSPHTLPPGGARNSALALVETPWVAFLDDDDLWDTDRLRSQFDALEADAADWSTTGEIRFLDRSRLICGWARPPSPSEVWPRILGANCIPGGGSAVLARTELIRELGGFREDVPRAEDWELWIRLARSSRLAVVDRPLVAYRVSGWSRSHQHTADVNHALRLWMDNEYGELRREYGVVVDDLAMRLSDAAAAARAGRRWQATRAYLGSAVGHRRPKQLAAGLAAAIAPRRFACWEDRRGRAHVEQEWLAQGTALIARAYAPAG